MPHKSTRLRIRNVGFLRVAVATAAVFFALPAIALAGATVSGAMHAVEHAVAEEGGSATYDGTPQVHCRPTAPLRFGCTFLNLTRGLSGRVGVIYEHRHYYVGEPVYERPHEYTPLCGTAYTC